MMDRCQRPLLLLWLTAAVAVNILRTSQANDEVKNLTNMSLHAIPHDDNSSSVTKLVIEGNFINLTEADRQALASYGSLVKLHLDGNLVTSIPAKYFDVVPHLQVLSLSGNKINCLDPESFSGLDFLTELDLSNNLLTSLHTQPLKQLKTLQMLNLQDNPWNCTCPLLSSIREVKAAVTDGGPHATCASPENQAGKDIFEAMAKCCPSPSPTPIITGTQKPLTPVRKNPSTALRTSLTSQNRIKKDQTPAVGNSWKFTASVAFLALFTCMLIVCAIKGPSLYKVFHNYRHRRLHEQEDEDEDVVSTVFSEREGYLTHQTFTFEQENAGTEEEEEEEEDEYFEDPYIKRDDSHAGEEASAEP